MILRFEIANFRSFNEPTAMLLSAGREKLHRERLPVCAGAAGSVLPVAALYGANAAGKTNLIDALAFLRELVVSGVAAGQGIYRQPFRLDPASASRPTIFEIDIIGAGDRVFRYRLGLGEKSIEQESLTEILSTSEKNLFRRNAAEGGFETGGLEKLAADEKRREFIRFTAEGTRANQPFLAEARQRAVHELAPVYDWFAQTLTVLGTDATPITLEDATANSDEFRDFLLKRLKAADTGIQEVVAEDRPLDQVDELPGELKDQLRAGLRQDELRLIRTGKKQGRRLLARFRNGEIYVSTLRIKHTDADGRGVVFDLDEESDGTKRYIDLSLAFYALASRRSRHVFVVDELDRSLHPLLVREAIESFLRSCSPDSRTQLIVSTHDATLMTQDIFRRDEIWMAEKTVTGSTSLHSLGEFKDLRHDTELRRNYMQGRLGGVPLLEHNPATLPAQAAGI